MNCQWGHSNITWHFCDNSVLSVNEFKKQKKNHETLCRVSRIIWMATTNFYRIVSWKKVEAEKNNYQMVLLLLLLLLRVDPICVTCDTSVFLSSDDSSSSSSFFIDFPVKVLISFSSRLKSNCLTFRGHTEEEKVILFPEKRNCKNQQQKCIINRESYRFRISMALSIFPIQLCGIHNIKRYREIICPPF